VQSGLDRIRRQITYCQMKIYDRFRLARVILLRDAMGVHGANSDEDSSRNILNYIFMFIYFVSLLFLYCLFVCLLVCLCFVCSIVLAPIF